MQTTCPKCGYAGSRGSSCDNCGIIFLKYAKQEQVRRELEEERLNRKQSMNRQLAFSGALVGLAGLILASFMFWPESETGQRITDSTQARQDNFPWLQDTSGPGYWRQDGNQLNWVSTPGEEQLKNAGVALIRMSDAIGFVISKNCHAIINGDVSRQKSSSNQSSSYNKIEYENLLEQRREAEALFEEKRKDFVKNCRECDQQAFDRALGRYASKLKKVNLRIERASENMDRSRRAAERQQKLMARTDHGSVEARVVETSQEYNLTLVILDKPACDRLQPGDPSGLSEKQPVYTLSGNYSKRVLGGKYLGLSAQTGKHSYLLHDIEIPRRDLGAPLLDKQGKVLGITVAPLNGKPRAIPIDLALQELRLPI